MTKVNKIILYFFLTIFIHSCGSLSDAGKTLSNQKVRTTDEFLVKKRNPLVLPPNYEKIPEPGTMSQENNNEEDKIKKILKSPEKTSPTKSSSSVEQSILNKIRK